MLVEQDFRVARRGVTATNAFIMCHKYFPNKELYATKRMVHIIEEGPKLDLFNFERPSIDSSISSTVVPP